MGLGRGEATRNTRGKQKDPTKRQVSLRLDYDLLVYLRLTGPGWQTRANAALRKALLPG